MRTPEGARIGPNAATQLIAPLGDLAPAVFARAGLSAWLDAPPQHMIREGDAARLHLAVREILPRGPADVALSAAGRATADYLIGRRIPRAVRIALACLPRPLAARALTRAIAAHAWTFAGSGRFSAEVGREIAFEIEANPLAQAGPCVWHVAVFQRLYRRLVAKNARVEETRCCGAGAACCRFEVRLHAAARQKTDA